MTKQEKLLNQVGFHLVFHLVAKVLTLVISVIYLVQVEIFFQPYLAEVEVGTDLIYKLKHQ